MLKVNFYNVDDIPDDSLRYAVIVSRCQNRWIYCRHKDRSTWEIPGGRREAGEPILTTAKRELFEETGALSYDLQIVSAYSVTRESTDYGLLCFAEITETGALPGYEIETIQLFDIPPQNLTYPDIQPKLQAKIVEYLAQSLYL